MAQGTTAIAQRGLMHEDRTAYTPLGDPTIIAVEQHEAQMTDLGGTGSRPVVATLQALGLVIAYDCKAGNDTGGRVEILRQAFQHLPSSKRIETVHSTNRGQAAFRLIILRWRESLFADMSHSHGIATTRLDETPEAVVWRYNERAHIEHHINELKRGVGNVTANAMPFAIGVVPDSLFLAQRLLTMPADWQRTTIRRIRWLLVEVGGKLITHGRALILKLAASVQQYRLYQEMRRRTYALSSA